MSRRQRNSYFQCRQFRIEQGACAMKVTTDACLLGAMAPSEAATRILDIGAGSGLLALFCAQRSLAIIDAVEIDTVAAAQCRLNFANSPWAKRLFLHESSIQQFMAARRESYDLIISNPPFFSRSTLNACERATTARHSGSLPLSTLADAIARLLSAQGKAWVLLPPAEAEQLIRLAEPRALFCHRRIGVRSDPDSSPHRLILEFGKGAGECSEQLFTLYRRHPYHTLEAAVLFAPYYTRMRSETELEPVTPGAPRAKGNFGDDGLFR